MNKRNPIKILILFIVFFTFQWFAQYAAQKLSARGSRFFLILMYGGFFLRSFIWIEILRDMTLISAYSLSSLSYLIIPFLSWFVLGEAYSSSYLIGGILILAGISVFTVGEQKQNPFPAGEV